MWVCERCESPLNSDSIYEKVYGYGGWKDEEEYTGVNVYCTNPDCNFSQTFDKCELEDAIVFLTGKHTVDD